MDPERARREGKGREGEREGKRRGSEGSGDRGQRKKGEIERDGRRNRKEK